MEEKRLLSIKEFCTYTGLGRNSATKLAEKSGARIQCGRRALVDLRRFDAWLDENNTVTLN